MQFYEALETDDTIAIVFDGNEILLGFKVMEDLLKVMKLSGGSEAPDMQQWLAQAKAKFIPASNTVN